MGWCAHLRQTVVAASADGAKLAPKAVMYVINFDN